MSYQYIGNNGEFKLDQPEKISYLYFPLANESGVMSCVTPDLGGDSKLNQNTFFMPPASCENLHNDKSSRNFWCRVDGTEVWSLTGRSGEQQAMLFTDHKDDTSVEAGFMHHKITRTSKKYHLKSEITSFVPATGEKLELMRVSVKNLGTEPKNIQIISAIPIYGRSADNIRDHRHVTALLHRIETREFGVVVNPTMTFDERGHKLNHILYGVFGGNKEEHPIGFHPIVEDFIGEGGNLENPEAVYKKKAGVEAGCRVDGYEALGGLEFKEVALLPEEEKIYLFVMSYGTMLEEIESEAKHFLNEEVFAQSLEDTKSYWEKKVNISYHTGNHEFDQWMKWISFQPMLRRIYGCSFLPHHDYGKGGRGWRDLWQDCLALLMMEPSGVRRMLLNNFGGVRLDGTNATIIGSGEGEFIADRNNITRVWMDHGMWPFLTTNLYIQQTGDVNILLEEKSYFKDPQVCRGEKKDDSWSEEYGAKQKDEANHIYRGSILEHLLIQYLTAFFDVGEHNHIRIRGADWNDALDLAVQRGESVAFTMMYAKNLADIAEVLGALQKSGVEKVSLLKELMQLMDCDGALYDNITEKQKVLQQYCESCMHQVSGEKVEIDIARLQKDLLEKASWISDHVRKTEWIELEENCGWYNGYYDNSGNAVEGKKDDQIRMMLTGQVFAVMSGVAKDDQILPIVEAADRYLYNANVGGYRLNTDFKEVKMDLGRMFGFAYGHKENGAVFSHMTTMFGNALYQRNKPQQAYHVINSLFEHCNAFEKSKIYPGIPEYIDAKGRGVYHYLTGAASWMLLTVVTQMFGVRGEMGNLVFDPKLLPSQFDASNEASVELEFAGKRIKVVYENAEKLSAEEYAVKEIYLNGQLQDTKQEFCGIKASVLQQMPENSMIKVVLGGK